MQKLKLSSYANSGDIQQGRGLHAAPGKSF